MSDTKNTENESSGLKKSLRLIYVYAIAAGAIFTFIGYWDTIFYEYCGAGTFLGFILMTLLSVGRIFASDFGLFYQVPMDSGALYNVTQTVDTYVYRALIKNGDVGMSAAASLIQSIVGFVTVVTANWLVKKADSDSALF